MICLIASPAHQMTDDADSPMTDEQRQMWSRHYDAVQWGIIGVFSAAMGTLVLRSLDTCKTPWLTNSAGLIFSLAGLYYVACFRRWRVLLHRSMKSAELRAFFSPENSPNRVNTWAIFMLLIASMDAIFIVKLPKTGACADIFSVFVWLGMTTFLIWLWVFGNGPLASEIRKRNLLRAIRKNRAKRKGIEDRFKKI